MTTADPSKAFFDFWAAQGEALAKARENTTKAFADGMQAMSSGALPGVRTADGSEPDVAASAAEMERARTSLSDLWAAATALSGSIAQKFPTATGDKTADRTLLKMFDPNVWMGATGEMDEVLGRMAEGPRFADMWEVERRYARVLAAWMTVRRSALEHQSVVLEAWVQAGTRFNEELAGRTDAEAQTQDTKTAMALWADTANKQLLETQRSETFLHTQAATIRASTDLRMAQQEMIEHFGKQYGFPTRTELDDVHRTLTELRREVRAMRRAQRG